MSTTLPSRCSVGLGLAGVLMLALTGCGLADATVTTFLFDPGDLPPEGGADAPCTNDYECRWFDGLVCDDSDEVCVAAENADTDACENAHEELGPPSGGPAIFDVNASLEVMNPGGVGARGCLYGSLLVAVPPDELDERLDGNSGDRLTIETNVSNGLRDDGAFYAEHESSVYESNDGQFVATIVNFGDCWVEGAGFGDIPSLFAVQMFIDGSATNGACVELF